MADRRQVRDVTDRPTTAVGGTVLAERKRLRVGSLFAGIGGLELGMEWAGFGPTVWQVEWDNAATSVLERHWPDVTRYRDVRDVDWLDVEPAEVLCGGYPCQPFSKAGNRKGEADDRHMWPHYLDAIRTLRPRLAVLENVSGHFSLGFGRVLGDLAEIGFDAVWTSLRASDVGAPHQRERAFILAFPADTDSIGRLHGEAVLDAAEARLHALRDAPTGRRADAAHPDSTRPQGPQSAGLHARGPAAGGRGQAPSNTSGGERQDEPEGDGAQPPVVGAEPGAGDRAGAGESPEGVRELGRGSGLAWGEFGPAVRRWERLTGRPAPAPTDDQGRLSFDFSEWMMGFPAGWTDHIETRNARGRLIGNAVVPQCAEVVGRWAHALHRASLAAASGR